ncbi:MAG: FHA domain-containing protein [Pyrinomonadaceae bacterium]
MERIVLRHLSGSKANQVEEFPLSHVKELILGRDDTATVKYDPERDDLVGRQHAKIAQDPADSAQFILTDLNSRNGTFLNKQRITGTTRVGPGDVVQLGPGGPEFVFDLEPRPPQATKATRIATVPMTPGATAPGPPPTRIPNAGGSQPPYGASPPPPGGAPGSVGATVERMINQSVSQTSTSQNLFDRGGLRRRAGAFWQRRRLFDLAQQVGERRVDRSTRHRQKAVGDRQSNRLGKRLDERRHDQRQVRQSRGLHRSGLEAHQYAKPSAGLSSIHAQRPGRADAVFAR